MTTDQHLNTGAMALGALSDDEAASFVDHLETCDICAQELAGFRETAAILGSSVAQTPPASLRRSVMEAVARTPQLPPLTDSITTLGRHRQPAGPRPVDSSGPEIDQGSATERTATEQSPADQPGELLAEVIPLHRPWYRRTQGLIAAAVALLVIGGGAGIVIANSATPAAQTASECVAAAPDKSALTPDVGAGGDVAFSATCNAAVVNMPNLSAAPAGQVYQLWVLSGTKATSAGVVTPKADGSVTPVTTPVHAGNTAVGVTLEPAPGSTQPTTKPIWVVPLTA